MTSPLVRTRAPDPGRRGPSGVRGSQRLSTFLRRLTPPIPVILMSAYDEMVPGHLVLQKPFHPDQLIARVREVLEKATSTDS